MSARLSPDGMYYWDGAAWVTAISPDGRFRWDGTAWVPLQRPPFPTYSPQQPVAREPTSWTRPLQLAVAGWYALSALGALSLPFWFSSQVPQIVQDAMLRQQQQNPDLAPPPPGFADAMTSAINGALWVAAVIGFAIALTIIVGALGRWTWMYYAVLVLLGLGLVSGPVDLINIATGASTSGYVYRPPSWIYALGAASWIPSTALFVLMLVALVKRGPWGMRKVAAS